MQIQPYRAILFALVLIFIIAIAPVFTNNISYLLNPASLTTLASGQWMVVLIWIAAFSLFSLFLVFPRKRGEFRKYRGAYIAYIVALFTEMFGFPLTLYLLSGLLPSVSTKAGSPLTVLSFQFAGVQYELLLTSLIAGFISIIGGILIILGWKKIYNAKELITDGIYKYSRHPQYLGMSMIILAWMFAWPTIPTTIMGLILLVVYYRLAKTEERELETDALEQSSRRPLNEVQSGHGKLYTQYRKATPMYF